MRAAERSGSKRFRAAPSGWCWSSRAGAAQQAIRNNLLSLGVAARATLLPLRAESSLNALERLGPFSLVFADPPWADAQAALGVLEKLAASALLAPAARLVLEHAARTPPVSKAGARLRAVDTRRWGDTAVTIFELIGPSRFVPEPSS